MVFFTQLTLTRGSNVGAPEDCAISTLISLATFSDHAKMCLGLWFYVCVSNFLMYVRATQYFGKEMRQFA